MLGPIDYVAIGFKGNNFDGSIMDELSKAVESGVIRVVDLIFVIKDADGTVAAAEIEDQSAELRTVAKKMGHSGDMPLLSEADVDKMGQQMAPNTSAGILVIEHLWAKGLKRALMRAGGMLIADGRIHDDKVILAMAELDEINAG